MKFLRFLLFPFAIIYDAVTTIRNLFFDVGVFKQTSFKTPVIVVGNLSVGGTGKTPQIEYLIRLLKDVFKVSVLSRGYKRKTKGFVLLNNFHNALDVGDEPLQYFKKFTNITVAVDANRVEGVQNLIQQKSPDVILLDDAYQHRKIKGSFYILLTKYNDLFTKDFLLPTGNLRESRSGAKRADVIIVTKCPNNLDFNQQESIKRKLKKYQKEVFFTTISYGEIKSKQNLISVDDLKNYQVLLITGIANPNPLLNYLDDNKINYNHLKYADHHHFSFEEIKEIKEKFNVFTSDKKIILTTEKDYTRLSDVLEKLFYIEIETRFLDNQKEDFNQKIINHIQ
ncbi:tetraacyldisaccharide 4'-kinase [Polaribacter reichenbachii]|uniref:Tetraacyldisaccharide 4'-kinase n=1 Tax=Polaribacter reichenbachii TaxID=996801 RepID=A0A1B8U4U8_9FLAO|nr:tetraacyldisaccharide 4'-kinase [Polaribacter reichenbachii]APZ47957.1 tetraacyldisaccharide 4'-kinase [Polaribacter reichenbachii]AUC18592.1 tetraacyldisaccharide 4'-kinase [Polaribacter reichenbachii]OBY66886.1 tetraacyldisaccharide 4'-kinase [Polaribacter reichenbachii]